jgi:hypothetical protein
MAESISKDGSVMAADFGFFPSGSALPEAMPDIFLLRYTVGCP